MTKPATQQTAPKKHVIATGKKLKNGEALKIVFFAGKVLFSGDAKKAADLLNIKRRLN